MRKVRIKRNKFLKGFTLMEMMVVIAIMFIVVAVAMPNFWGGRGSKEHKGAARRIASTLQFAKGCAEAQNVVHHFLAWINSGNTISMDIYKTTYATFPPANKVGKSEKMTLSAPFNISTTLDVPSDGSTWGAYYIKFNPEGSADDGDAAIGDETITIWNTATGKSIDITISEDTGCISIGDLY